MSKFDPINTVRNRATGVYTYTDPVTGKSSIVDGPQIVEDADTSTDPDTGLVTHTDPKTGVITEITPEGQETVTNPADVNAFTPAYLGALALALQPYLANLAPVHVPRIDTVTPTNGVAGDKIIVTGQGFTGGLVSIGDVACTDVDITDRRLTFVVPEGAPSGAIVVRTKGQLKAVSAKFETNYYPPSKAELDLEKSKGIGSLKYISGEPLIGPHGTVVTMKGEGFTNVKKVSIGNNATGIFKVVDDETIEYTVPEGAKAGTLSVSDGVNPAVGSQWFKITK
jgi:IPT/TIG domain